MFSKDAWVLIGTGTVGAIVGGLIGRHLSKTIGKLQLDVARLDRRIIDLEIASLTQQLAGTPEEREAYVTEVFNLLRTRLAREKKVLPEDSNKELHKLRKRYVANEINRQEFAVSVLFGIGGTAE